MKNVSQQAMVKAKETAIPALGFGTFQLETEQAEKMVEEALGIGYRHIDTAQIYGNEAGVGKGVKNSGVARDKIFLTTKVWFDRFEPGPLKKSVEESLRKLQTDYVDLLLLHWPNDEVPLERTLGAFREVRAAGQTRAIGVSNFTPTQLQRAIDLSDDSLVTNQVEYHPFLDQERLLALTEKHTMVLTAYSPLARGKVLQHDLFRELAGVHNSSPTAIALAWLLSHPNVSAIPKASSVEHASQNFQALEVDLSPEEIDHINRLRTREGRLINPDFAPDWE